MNVPVKRGTVRRLGLARVDRSDDEAWTSWLARVGQAYDEAWLDSTPPPFRDMILNSRMLAAPPMPAQPFAVTPCARCGHLASDHHKLHCEALGCDCSGGFLTP